MNIDVVGSGAVGSLLGGLALAGGHEVRFFPSDEARRQMAARGLRLVLPQRWVHLPRIEFGDKELRKPELTLVALKRNRLRELKRLPGGETTGAVLFLNCEPEDVRLPTTPVERTWYGYTLFTSVMLQPGETELASRRSCILLPRHSLLERLAPAWKGVGIEVHFVDDIESSARSFFLWQLLFLPVALCHSTYDHFLSSADGQRVAAGVLREGLETFQRLGGKLRKLPFMDPQELLALIEKRPGELAARAAQPDRSYNSLLQSILRGRRTEVKELNEKLVRLATEAGVDPRWNWRLSRKIGRVVQLGFYSGPGELRRALE